MLQICQHQMVVEESYAFKNVPCFCVNSNAYQLTRTKNSL